MMLSIERYGAIQLFNICRMILRPSIATPDRVESGRGEPGSPHGGIGPFQSAA